VCGLRKMWDSVSTAAKKKSRAETQRRREEKKCPQQSLLPRSSLCASARASFWRIGTEGNIMERPHSLTPASLDGGCAALIRPRAGVSLASGLVFGVG